MTGTVLTAQSHLTTRDLILLGWLADHGVLTSFQIANALFPSLDFAQRRLRKLCQLHVIARFRPQKPDGGSYPYHYVLDQLGADIIAAQRGQDPPRRDWARKRQWALTHRGNLPHRLAITQFFTDLAGYARTHPDAALLEWKPTSHLTGSGAISLFGLTGANPPAYHVPSVEPDGYGYWHEGGYRVPFFVEIDRATEPTATLTGKVARYQRAAKAAGRAYPLLFVVPSLGRERNLHQQLSAASHWYPIATAATDDMTSRHLTPADAVWRIHNGHPGQVRLADLDDLVIILDAIAEKADANDE